MDHTSTFWRVGIIFFSKYIFLRVAPTMRSGTKRNTKCLRKVVVKMLRVADGCLSIPGNPV